MASKRKASELDGGIQAMSDVEHVRLRSGMYVGSTTEEEREALCASVDAEGGLEVKRRRVTVVPALLKLFDEVVSNALDEAWKGRGVTAIKISVTDKAIVVHNTGEGITTGMHSALGVPVIQARGGWAPISEDPEALRGNRLLSLELGSARVSRSPAKPFEAVRQDRVWAEPSSRGSTSIISITNLECIALLRKVYVCRSPLRFHVVVPEGMWHLMFASRQPSACARHLATTTTARTARWRG